MMNEGWTHRHLKALHELRSFERTAVWTKQDKPLIKRINKGISYLERRSKLMRKARTSSTPSTVPQPSLASPAPVE